MVAFILSDGHYHLVIKGLKFISSLGFAATTNISKGSSKVFINSEEKKMFWVIIKIIALISLKYLQLFIVWLQ